MDDGTIARLAEEDVLRDDDVDRRRARCSSGSSGGTRSGAWTSRSSNVTGALAAVNVAGPNARDADGAPHRPRCLERGRSSTSTRSTRQVAGVPCLILRIGFVGELGYELHFPSPYGEYLWDTILEHGRGPGIRPFGLEPQRILRLEKMHILVGQDTDSESNVLEANMPWIVKWDKDDFVGKWALEHVQERGFAVAARRLRDGERASSRPRAARSCARAARRPRHELALERGARQGDRDGLGAAGARRGRRPDPDQGRGRLEEASVRLRPFFDPDGEQLRS